MAAKGSDYLISRIGGTSVKLDTIKNGKLLTDHSLFCNLTKDNEKTEIYSVNEDYHERSFDIYGFMNNHTLIRHRVGNPAIIYHDNNESFFYFNGFRVVDLSQYCYLCDLSRDEELILVLKYDGKL